MSECNFKNCKYCVESNCISKKEYDTCDYAKMMEKKEIMCDILSAQGAASVLSSNQSFREWLARGINCVRELDRLSEHKLLD